MFKSLFPRVRFVAVFYSFFSFRFRQLKSHRRRRLLQCASCIFFASAAADGS